MERYKQWKAKAAAEARAERNQTRDKLVKEKGFHLDRKTLLDLTTTRDAKTLAGLGGVPSVITGLKTSVHGLDPSQVDVHRACFGANRLAPKRRKWWLEHFYESITDLTLLILLAGAIISIVFGAVTARDQDAITGGAIMLAVVVVSCTTSTVNYVQEQQFASLAKVKEDRTVLVVRNGEEVSVSVYDVVVGDVFVVKAGELLPCDGLLLSGNGIKCDESAMTGESLEISKSPTGDVFMVGGAQVTAGAGRFVVLSVGEETSYGIIIKALEDVEPPPTPLQEKLELLAKRIRYVGMVAGALLFAILLGLYLTIESRRVGTETSISVLSFFLLAVTLVVVAVPEGLPMAVILSLAFSMKRMVKDKVLVRKLNSVETMGSATCICSDKTGTLTQNRMTVTAGRFLATHYGSHVPSVPDMGKPGESTASILALAMSLNSDAALKSVDNGTGGMSTEFLGNKTEGAMLHMLATAWGRDYAAVRKAAVEAAGTGDGAFFLFRENFSSLRKRMTTVMKADMVLRLVSSGSLGPCDPTVLSTWLPGLQPGGAVVLSKGAAEIVTGLCVHEATAGGGAPSLTPVTPARALAINENISTLATRGLRTLAVAATVLPPAAVQSILSRIGTTRSGGSGEEKPIPIASEADAWEAAVEDGSAEVGLTLLSLVGIRDPPRPEVPAAVAACKRALIRVRMVTGDNVDTARAIAAEVGIYKGGVVMEGREWRALTQEGRKAVVVDLDVLARAIPTDKLLLVQALQELGDIVAVTGDGSNDAPALNAAHVGCAMGIAGTEVAKEAADLVILDDNFSSIVNAVLWGRAVLENIRKFLAFQLVVNITAVVLTIVMACLEGGSVTNFPLTPIQLLWINLIMDSFAALALATEPPDAALLKQRPEGRTRPLVSKIMWKMVAGQSVVQTALLLFLTLSDAGASIYNPANGGLDGAGYVKGGRVHLTCIFNSFVFLTLFNKFNARKLHDEWNIMAGFLHSFFAPAIIVLIFVLQIIIVQVGGELVMQTVPLDAYQWIICILIGCLTFPIGFALRLVKTHDAAIVSEEDFIRMTAQEEAERAVRLGTTQHKGVVVRTVVGADSSSAGGGGTTLVHVKSVGLHAAEE